MLCLIVDPSTFESAMRSQDQRPGRRRSCQVIFISPLSFLLSVTLTKWEYVVNREIEEKVKLSMYGLVRRIFLTFSNSCFPFPP